MITQEQKETQSQEIMFPYFEGSIDQLAADITRRRSNPQLASLLDEMLSAPLGITFSFTRLQQSFFPGDNRVFDIQIAPHLAKPDIATLSAYVICRILSKEGYPSRLTIRTLPDDIYVDESQDRNGIKPAYANMPFATQSEGGLRFDTYTVLDDSNIQGKRLRTLEAGGTTLPDYYARMVNMAGIKATIVDGSRYHSTWLGYLLENDVSQMDKDLRKTRIFVSQDDGTRSGISVEKAIAEYNTYSRNGKSGYLSRLSPSADLYYRLVPAYLAGFIDGSGILLESYEDDPNFLKRVLSGVKKLQSATGELPLVTQSAWLSGVTESGDFSFNDIDTDWNSSLSSLTIPLDLLGNTRLCRLYYEKVVETVCANYDIKSLTLTQLQQIVIEHTVEFLVDQSNFSNYGYNSVGL